jgi:tetratricopeptide (TPR) repeat protein
VTRRFSEAFTMDIKSTQWIILGLLLAPVAARTAAQQIAANQPGQPPRPQLNSDSARPALSPRDMQVEKAKILMAEKRYDACIQAYQDLLKTEPKNALFMNMIGIAYLDLSNTDEAKKYFQRAEKADKKYPSAVNNLGMVYYTQKNYRRAIREYQRAVKIDQTQAGTHANLGFAYYNTNKYPEASIEFQKALELDPHVLERNSNVGTMMQDRSVSNHGLFFFTMARVYAQKKDAEHCAEYLRKSYDEGYKDVVKVKTDPAFKEMLSDPGVQAVLVIIFPTDQKATTAPPGA